MKLIFKKLDYPVLMSSIFTFCCLLFTITEVDRIIPNLKIYYVLTKATLFTLGAIITFYLYKNKNSELGLTLLIILGIIYVWSNMWFAPLYEIAYLQFIVGAAFFKFQKKWTYLIVFSTGLIGIFLNYYLQNLFGWKIPAISFEDWIWSCSIFLMLGFCIREFAIKTYVQAYEKELKFSIIGKETTRLLHDLKGMMTMPLMRLESLIEQNNNHTTLELLTLKDELYRSSETLKKFHILVAPSNKLERVNVNSAIENAIHICKSRIERNEAKISVNSKIELSVLTNESSLISIFFNLILNSLEAFENSKKMHLVIDIDIQSDRIVFSDNVGGFSEDTNKTDGRGLGLELIYIELSKMQSELIIKARENSTSFIISVTKNLNISP